MGEGLSGPREGCGGFRFDSNSPERVGEGSKGAKEGCGGLRSVCSPSQGVCERSKGAACVIKLGAGGGPVGAERGLWRVQG